MTAAAQSRRDGLIAMAKSGALSRLQAAAAMANRRLCHPARRDRMAVTDLSGLPRSGVQSHSLPDEALGAAQILAKVDGYVRDQLPSTPRSVALVQRVAGEEQTVQALATTELPDVDRSRAP